MTSAKKYLADLVSGGLLLTESRVIAQLLLAAQSDEEWYQQVVNGNVLQKKSEHTALRYARTIRRRIEPLGPEFIADVLHAHEGLYKQLLLLATILHSPALGEFMDEIIREAKRVYLPSIPLDAWETFLDSKYRLIEDLSRMSESTLKKSGVNVIRALVEAGYLNNNRERRLQPVYLLPETRRWLLILGREDLEPIMECTL